MAFILLMSESELKEHNLEDNLPDHLAWLIFATSHRVRNLNIGYLAAHITNESLDNFSSIDTKHIIEIKADDMPRLTSYAKEFKTKMNKINSVIDKLESANEPFYFDHSYEADIINLLLAKQTELESERDMVRTYYLDKANNLFTFIG